MPAPDLTCEFDANAGTAAIVDRTGNAVMFGQNLQDVSNSGINRIFGARPGKDYEGDATLPKGNGQSIGDFTVSQASANQISCKAPGIGPVLGPKR
ncbi:MAG TPA: hypothetical protein PLE43_08905 [Alphaproteobacteria bacterium]|jgi:hypothetical protein|nr:hypothetical protein [Alphaproteobacteria bacterium]HRK98577.1 hypothetical protein [Alphaproteobacteria bacterium]